MPQSGMTVEPMMMPPASSTRSTTGELRVGSTGVTPALPEGIGTPARARFSLTVTGMPSRAPTGWPAAHRRSLARACSSRASGRVSRSLTHRALSVGSRSATTSATSQHDVDR